MARFGLGSFGNVIPARFNSGGDPLHRTNLRDPARARPHSTATAAGEYESDHMSLVKLLAMALIVGLIFWGSSGLGWIFMVLVGTALAVAAVTTDAGQRWLGQWGNELSGLINRVFGTDINITQSITELWQSITNGEGLSGIWEKIQNLFSGVVSPAAAAQVAADTSHTQVRQQFIAAGASQALATALTQDQSRWQSVVQLLAANEVNFAEVRSNPSAAITARTVHALLTKSDPAVQSVLINEIRNARTTAGTTTSALQARFVEQAKAMLADADMRKSLMQQNPKAFAAIVVAGLNNGAPVPTGRASFAANLFASPEFREFMLKPGNRAEVLEIIRAIKPEHVDAAARPAIAFLQANSTQPGKTNTDIILDYANTLKTAAGDSRQAQEFLAAMTRVVDSGRLFSLKTMLENPALENVINNPATRPQFVALIQNLNLSAVDGGDKLKAFLLTNTGQPAAARNIDVVLNLLRDSTTQPGTDTAQRLRFREALMKFSDELASNDSAVRDAALYNLLRSPDTTRFTGLLGTALGQLKIEGVDPTKQPLVALMLTRQGDTFPMLDSVTKLLTALGQRADEPKIKELLGNITNGNWMQSVPALLSVARSNPEAWKTFFTEVGAMAGGSTVQAIRDLAATSRLVADNIKPLTDFAEAVDRASPGKFEALWNRLTQKDPDTQREGLSARNIVETFFNPESLAVLTASRQAFTTLLGSLNTSASPELQNYINFAKHPQNVDALITLATELQSKNAGDKATITKIVEGLMGNDPLAALGKIDPKQLAEVFGRNAELLGKFVKALNPTGLAPADATRLRLLQDDGNWRTLSGVLSDPGALQALKLTLDKLPKGQPASLANISTAAAAVLGENATKPEIIMGAGKIMAALPLLTRLFQTASAEDLINPAIQRASVETPRDVHGNLNPLAGLVHAALDTNAINALRAPQIGIGNVTGVRLAFASVLGDEEEQRIRMQRELQRVADEQAREQARLRAQEVTEGARLTGPAAAPAPRGRTLDA